MADLGSGLVARLIAASGVQSLVGSKVHWVKVPQTTEVPYVRMQVISDDRGEDLDGYTGTHETRVQVDCFAATHAASQKIAEAIVAATSRPSVVEGVVFGRIKADGPRDLGEDVPGKGFIHRASLDLLVWHRLA
ncbi:DUF3168 domain-containing protein [uncultured Novosphingobium sp.]|uniref:tail completion protein gp17 n=1 Tax=uncultured Novosphingobium sp. TaxID=292277 RepID=UPI003748D11F